MRILVVSHNYPRFPGDPAGAYVARLARTAQAAGAQVRVLAPHAPGTAREESDGGVPVHRFRYAPDALERIGYRGDVRARTFFSPLSLLVLPLYLGVFRRAVRRAIAEFSPDVIHAHWWFPAGWVVAGVGGGRPYMVTCHGSDVRLLDRGALFRRLARRILGGAGAVTTVSRFLAADVTRHLSLSRLVVTVAPMPIDVDRFAAGRSAPKAQPPRVLYAGNLLESKGVDVLLRALKLLRECRLPCRVKVLGEGPARADLGRLAEQLGVAGDVDWSGFVPQDAMPAEYGASTVTALPTRGMAEGLGLTLVEALLAGSAVVGTPAGGIPEVVADGETGLIARDGDPQHLADQLTRLLTDPALRTRLTDTGARRMRETYSPAAAGGRFLALYDAVARDHTAR
jgi:glycosyltransferase involved in cell wall biosynthesis